MSTSLFIALVLYRTTAEQCVALQTLVRIVRDEPTLGESLRLLVFDNSPEPQQLPPLPLQTEYISAPANPGLAEAYNTALNRAAAAGSAWLLLLDQDTVLISGFLNEVKKAIDNADLPKNVAVMVPRLVEGAQTHSPTYLPQLSHKPVRELSGLLPQEVTAFNSGSVWRVLAITEVGGFPSAYPLDFLDHASFAQMQRAGGRVWLLRSRLQHTLSTAGEAASINPVRYRNMLMAERRFHHEYATRTARIWYCLRKLKQAVGRLRQQGGSLLAQLELRAGFDLLE